MSAPGLDAVLVRIPSEYSTGGGLRFEKDFARALRHWDQPLLPTTDDGFKTYLSFPEQWGVPPKDVSDTTIDFVRACYDEDSCGFRLSPQLPNIVNVHNLRSALSIVWYRHRDELPILPKKDRPAAFRVCLARYFAEKTVESLARSAYERLDEILEPYNPGSTIHTLNSALWVYEKLNVDIPSDIKNRILLYLALCARNEENGGQCQFALGPLSTDICLSAYFLAHQIAALAGLKKALAPQWSMSLPYLLDCWDTEEGGFSVTSRRNDLPNIINTYFALFLNKNLYSGKAFRGHPEIDIEASLRFIEKCLVNGGYGFRKDAIEANIYANRLALRSYLIAGKEPDSEVKDRIVASLDSFAEDGLYKGVYNPITSSLVAAGRREQDTMPQVDARKDKLWHDEWRKQVDYFESNKERWLSEGKYNGKFVAIVDQKIVDHDDDEFELLDRMECGDQEKASLVVRVVQDPPPQLRLDRFGL